MSGSADVAEYLLAHGADPSAAARNGVTPLHAAAMRGLPELVALLLASGAPRDAEDRGGRTPLDWAVISGRTEVVDLLAESVAGVSTVAGPAPAESFPLLETGIKALDLLAPFPRRGLVRWDGSYGLGQMVLFAELMTVLARPSARCVWIGFEWEYLNVNDLRKTLKETGIGGDVILRLAPEQADEHDRRSYFEDELARVDRELEGRDETLLFVVDRPGHAADVESALPALRGRAALLATVVVSPRDDSGTPKPGVPAGYDARIALDRRRVCRGLVPAVHLTLSQSHALTPGIAGDRHCYVAARARECLLGYEALDPALAMPDGEAFKISERQGVRRSQLLHVYLSQPLHVAEPFVAKPGTTVRLVDTVTDVEDILDGRLDQMDPAELFDWAAIGT